jgi:hypothetical protein
MNSFRDELLDELPPLLRVKALQLGASARLADDDIAWVLLVAATRLDFELLSRAAQSKVTADVQRVVKPFAESAIQKISEHVMQLVSKSIDAGMEGVVLRQNNRQLVLGLVFSLTFAASIIGAAWAGAKGWTAFREDEIEALNAERAKLERTQPPAWLGWWGQSSDGTPTVFVRASASQLIVRPCTMADREGTCITAGAR